MTAAASGSIVLWWWAVSHQVPPLFASQPEPTMNFSASFASARYFGLCVALYVSMNARPHQPESS